ncbi:stearoyl-CoA desaturase 5-like [Centruroides vittatus]|uniref:stearoyl-CoA desaturase 5-like n=1 Tax=Centruroides vittatus TaxID=120091 RepID=UPI00350F72F6
MAPSQTFTTVTETQKDAESKRYPMKIVWRNVIAFIILHIGALYGIYLANWRTFTSASLLAYLSILGVTGGSHRLWSHRSYKAKWPVRVFLMFFQTMAIQNDIYEWSRDHRAHHKYSETDADPHNATRGFFFSHMGWLMVKKHPDVKEKGKSIDMSDLLRDPVVVFQRKYYYILVVLISVVIPTMIPVLFWGESVWSSLFTQFFSRYVVSLHGTWLVNSAAHMWGNRPYDRFINPRESPIVHIFSVGEGFHNYHHTFPWDYCTSEFGWKLNSTALFIDCMAWLGLVYDRKKASPEIIQQRKERTGEKL